MDDYSHRGRTELITMACGIAASACLAAFRSSRVIGISIAIASAVLYLPRYIALRKMSEEQYRKLEEKEEKKHDAKWAARCVVNVRASLIALAVALGVGAVSGFLRGDTVIGLYSLGLEALLGIAPAVGRRINRRKRPEDGAAQSETTPDCPDGSDVGRHVNKGTNAAFASGAVCCAACVGMVIGFITGNTPVEYYSLALEIIFGASVLISDFVQRLKSK